MTFVTNATISALSVYSTIRGALAAKGIPEAALHLLIKEQEGLLANSVADLLLDAWAATENPSYPVQFSLPDGKTVWHTIWLLPHYGHVEEIVTGLKRVGMAPATRVCGEMLISQHPEVLNEHCIACLGTREEIGLAACFPCFRKGPGEKNLEWWMRQCVLRQPTVVAALRVQPDPTLKPALHIIKQ